jgi:hypothetical protein
VEKIHSNYEEFSYSKVVYREEDPVHGMDVEFVQSCDCLKTFLVVHSTAVPPTQEFPKKISVKIEIDDTLLACLADRMEGGQRFLLSEEVANKVIEALLNEKNVHISIPGYRSSLNPEGFQQRYKKIGRSIMENPFHLPF